MIKNLLYSISLHLFLIFISYSGTILYKPKKYLNLNTDYVTTEFDKKKLSKIKNNLSDNSKFSNLTLKQKISLYENYDKIKSIKTVDYNKIKSKLKNNVVFKNKSITSTSSDSKNVSSNDTSSNKNNDSTSINKSNYNIVTKEHHNVYVAESKMTKEQVKKAKEQNKIKEKIRSQIKTVDKVKKEEKKEKIDLDTLLKDLDKDLATVNNTENKDNFKVVNTNENSKDLSEFEELSNLMNIDDIEELMKIKDEVSEKDIATIFTKEDYDVMSNKKSNSIYELSFREKNNIQKQIKICYRNAVLKTQKNSSLVMSAKISLARSGQIDMNSIIFKVENDTNIESIDKDDYFTTIENIKLALVYCNPLRGLPEYKYNIWKNMNLTFNNN